jgi:hypothetical protein
MTTWQRRLRQIVDEEHPFGPVKRALMRVIDPADVYMRRDDGWPPRRSQLGGWTYTPLNSPGETSISPGEPPVDAPMKPRTRRDVSEHRERIAELQTKFASYFETRVDQLMRDGACLIHTTGGILSAQLVRFRGGAAVLETSSLSTDSESHIKVRLDEINQAHLAEALTRYIAQRVVELGSESRPLLN